MAAVVGLHEKRPALPEKLKELQTKGKKINMEFKRNNQPYKNIYNPIYKSFIAASQILIDFLKYPFGDYFCYLF